MLIEEALINLSTQPAILRKRILSTYQPHSINSATGRKVLTGNKNTADNPLRVTHPGLTAHTDIGTGKLRGQGGSSSLLTPFS